MCVVLRHLRLLPVLAEPQENKQLEAWLNREITPDEHVAAIKIQKVWRGFFVRKVRLAQSHGAFLLWKRDRCCLRGFLGKFEELWLISPFRQ